MSAAPIMSGGGSAPSQKRRRLQLDRAPKVPQAGRPGDEDFATASHWLVKAEPAEYSVADFEKDGLTEWDGVRNYSARNNLRRMRKGQRVLYYESNPARGDRPGVVGHCTIDREDYPDPTQFNSKHAYYDRRSKEDNPTWACVDLKFGSRLSRRVTLDELREQLPACGLFRFPRLSVVPLREREYEQVLQMSETVPPEPKPKAKPQPSGKASQRTTSSSKAATASGGAKAKAKAKAGRGRGVTSETKKSKEAQADGKDEESAAGGRHAGAKRKRGKEA